MPNLWDLDARATALYEALHRETEEPLTEEQQAEVVDAYLAADAAINDKLDAYCAVLRLHETRRAARRAEADRYAALAASDEAVVTRLKARLKAYLELRGTTKLETDRNVISVQKNGGKVPVEYDPGITADDLDEEWTRVRREIDRERVRLALEDGIELCFARLGERGSSVRVR